LKRLCAENAPPIKAVPLLIKDLRELERFMTKEISEGKRKLKHQLAPIFKNKA
jgi:hypothetical protein